MSKENNTNRPDNWEDICIQCGLCCLVKLRDSDGNIFLTKILCDNLDRETKKCKCYSADFNSRGGCSAHMGSRLDMYTLKNDYIVPGCCPYVKKYIVKNNLKIPKINLKECIYEKNLTGKDSPDNYVIADSWNLFKYNKHVNRRFCQNACLNTVK